MVTNDLLSFLSFKIPVLQFLRSKHHFLYISCFFFRILCFSHYIPILFLRFSPIPLFLFLFSKQASTFIFLSLCKCRSAIQDVPINFDFSREQRQPCSFLAIQQVKSYLCWMTKKWLRGFLIHHIQLISTPLMKIWHAPQLFALFFLSKLPCPNVVLVVLSVWTLKYFFRTKCQIGN
jgi:hypothetical protein